MHACHLLKQTSACAGADWRPSHLRSTRCLIPAPLLLQPRIDLDVHQPSATTSTSSYGNVKYMADACDDLHRFMWIVTAIMAPVFGTRELKKLMVPIVEELTSQLSPKAQRVVKKLLNGIEFIMSMVQKAGGMKAVMRKAKALTQRGPKGAVKAGVAELVKHNTALIEMADVLGLPPQAQACINGLIGLAQRDLDAVGEMAVELGGFDKSKMESLIKMIEGAMKVAGQVLDKVQDTTDEGEPKEVEPLTEGEEAQLAHMFKRFDADESGSIDYHEFQEVMRHMNLSISGNKAVQLFAQVDTDASGVLDFNEFHKAVQLLKENAADATLSKLGFSMDRLIIFFVGLCLLLLALLGFLFAGISAFTEDSSFGAVVNSVIPLMLGGGLASQGPNTEESSNPSKLQENVKKIMESFQPSK